MYIMCVILCLFSALSRKVGVLQIYIIIIIKMKSLNCPSHLLQSCIHPVSHSRHFTFTPFTPFHFHPISHSPLFPFTPFHIHPISHSPHFTFTPFTPFYIHPIHPTSHSPHSLHSTFTLYTPFHDHCTVDVLSFAENLSCHTSNQAHKCE